MVLRSSWAFASLIEYIFSKSDDLSKTRYIIFRFIEVFRIILRKPSLLNDFSSIIFYDWNLDEVGSYFSLLLIINILSGRCFTFLIKTMDCLMISHQRESSKNSMIFAGNSLKAQRNNRNKKNVQRH